MPGRQDDRGMLVTLDQDAALVVGRKVHRTDHPVTTPLTQPALRDVQQRTTDLGIVLALEPPKQTPVIVLELVEVAIHVRADPADRASVTISEEVLRLGVLEKRI